MAADLLLTVVLVDNLATYVLKLKTGSIIQHCCLELIKGGFGLRTLLRNQCSLMIVI